MKLIIIVVGIWLVSEEGIETLLKFGGSLIGNDQDGNGSSMTGFSITVAILILVAILLLLL